MGFAVVVVILLLVGCWSSEGLLLELELELEREWEELVVLDTAEVAVRLLLLLLVLLLWWSEEGLGIEVEDW